MTDKNWWEAEYSSKAKPGNWWEADTVSSTVGKKITDSVNSWLKNHKNYVANYQYRTKDRKYTYEDDYVSDPNDWLDTVSQQKKAFDESADSILAYMDRYKGFLDADFVKSVQDTLTGARGQQKIVVDNATADSKWWRNFANEEEYKTAQRYDGYSKKYTGQKYDDIQKALSLLDDGEEKWWLSQTQYDLYKGDGAYTSKADSGLKSFEAKKIAEREQEADKTWWERVAENYANSSPDTSLPTANLSIVTSGYRNDTSYREPNEKWSDGERRQFGYLYAEDPNKAYAYAEQVNNKINAKEKYAQQQAVGAWAGQNFGTGTAGTIGAIATAPMGLADFLDDMAEYAGRGTITQKGGLSPFEMGQAAQSGVANKLNEKYGTIDGDKFIFGGKGWGDVYSLGVSAANSLLSAYTLGGTGTLVNFIGQGGAAGVDDALSRGATPEQALLYGTIVGAAEGVTEMINADNLLKVGSSATLKNYLLKALNQGIGESIEEGASSLIGNIADNIIMQDKSNFYTTVQQLMEDNPGMSEEEAKNKAWVNMVGGMVFDAMGGFATGSGNAMLVGGASTAWDARKGNQKNIDAVKQYGDYTADLIQEGLQSDKKSESYQLAEKYQKQTQGKDGKSGKAMTGFQIRNLVAANDAQFKVEDFREVRNQAKDRLKELGENASEMWPIAELVAKRVTGQELTRKEKSTLARSQFGAKVAKEMTESAKQNKLTYKSLEERIGTEGRFGVSENGQATVRGTDEAFDLTKAEVVQAGEGQMTFMVGDKEVSAGDIDFADESQSFLVSAVSDIENITPAAANAVMRDIVDASKPLGAQLNGIDEAYTYGFNGYSEEDLKAGDYAPSLTDKQMMSAYKLGQAARNASDVAADAPIIKMRTAWEAKLTAKQKTEQQKARIESDDVEVYFEDGGNVVKFDEHTGEYDDKRMTAVNTAKFLSKLGIGGKYYFFESYENAAGERVYKDANGNEVEAPNGIYREADGSIHIDLNAGDAGQGTAAYTLGHELGHFVKGHSKKQFKILGDLVTEAFDKSDVSMHDRVVAKQDFLSTKRGHHVTYSEAFEEVVADAMSTMITDGTFHEKIMEIKVKDKGLFNTIKRFFEKMISKFRKAYADLTPDQKDAQDIREMKEMFDKIQTAFAEALVEASDNFHAAMESVVEAKSEPISADEILTDGAVVTDGNGEKHSIRSMKHDIAEGKMFEDLKKVCGWTDAQVVTLRNQLNDLVEYMIPYRDILDMNESYGMEGRRFSPYKPNSDPLYKISMDFSTLCSKRLLTQYVIENLQLRENRPMSAEEQMAIRDMLNEYRKVEKGLQVACAMCYVEAARLKSPKQMQRWLDDPAPLLKDYFGKKNKAFNDSVKEAQADFKESKGYDREAPKKDMKPADVKELNKIGPKMRSQYQLSAEEQAIVDRAKQLPNSTYLTAGNLANLSETDPVIYDAYTAFVRTATRSKSLETDEPYYYGDSMRDNGNGIVVTDSFIEAVNRENGMRFSSWSDWRIQHMLDYITAVIDNSVRGAAMHGYTKFGEEVRVLGKTGMMFNMSGVAGTQTGLNKDGSLNFSDTESIDVNEAIQLRNELPETAGLQCIGVGDDHITALLRSDIIDYVIPYHVSGLNAALRRMADIHGWKDYTSTQHAAIDKSIKFDNAVDQEHWHEEPVYSEFFVGYDTGMTGIEAMRASAEKYKQMCKDRGLTPKFNQFASEENYWKLLIDRKMINQQTGKLIQQKAVTPTFDFGTIKEVVDRHVQNYDAGLEKRALNHIVENWDTIPQRIKDLKKGGTKSKQTKKSVDTLANQTVAAQPKDTGVKKSDRVQKWKPNLDSTEWDIVKYTVDKNQGTAITSTCNMFFKKSKGKTLFGIYSTDDSTLLYASREKTAERERLFLEQFLKEYENGNVTDTSAEGLHTWAKAIRVRQNTSTRDDSTYVAPGRSAGNAGLHGRPSGLYASPALRNVLENIFQKETAGRTGDGRVKNSDRDSTGKQLTKEQQEYFANSVVRDAAGRLMVMYHGTANGGAFTIFDGDQLGNEARTSQVGQGFYFTNAKAEAEAYTKNVDIYGRSSKGKNPYLHEVYLNITNPFNVAEDTLNLDDVKAVYGDGTYDYFFDSWIPFYLNRKSVNGEVLTKAAVQAMSNEEKVSLYVDYLAQLGTKELLSNMVRAFPYGKQSELLAAMQNRLGYDGIVEEYAPGKYQYVAFSSEQVKSVDNKKPTADKDIRYSERDSNGKQLTEDQLEYFEKSMARDRNGSLQVVYHGGTVKFEFDTSRGAAGKTEYGPGAYFTESEFIAKQYSWARGGNVKEYYLNIERMFDDTDMARTVQMPQWQKLEQILQRNGIDEKYIQQFREYGFGYMRRYLAIKAGDRTSDNWSGSEQMNSMLREAGFDGVKGPINDSIQYVIFTPNQAKLTTNEVPSAFYDTRYSERTAKVDTEGMSSEAKKIISNLELRARFSRYSKGEYASYSTERIERELNRSAATKMDYAKSYIAWVKPEDFLYATTTSEAGRAQIEKEAGELDLERLRKETQPIHLTVDFETGKIVGHEGRHRMMALHKAGVEKVAVIFDAWNDDRYNTKPVDMMKIGGQEFDKYHGGLDFYVHDMLPLSRRYADATRKLFSEVSGSVKFSERTGDSVSNRHLLANAFEGIVQNSIEYKLIQEYKDQIKALNKLEELLSDTNAEIRKLTFGTDGERDSEKLKDLRDKAKRLANDINRHDKKLLSLEASEPLRKVIERERAKASQKTKDHVKEIQQNKKVRAEQAELRHKIRKAVRDLDKILKHGNKQKNVKEDLQPVVTKALKAADILFTENYGNYDMLRNGIGADLSDSEEELVNTCARMLRDIDKMPTDGYDSWQARQEAEKRLSTKMTKLKDVFARERKRLNNTTVSSILGELADAYASLKDSEQGYVQGAYMEPVHEFLKSLQIEVGGAIVKDMTKDQLESVYAAYKMVLTTVRKANELFNKGIKMSREQLGNAVIQEVTKAGGTHGLWTKGEIARSQADWNNTKPVWVANRIGSESFSKLMQGLFEGQYNFAVDIEEAKQFKLSMDQKYHPRNWDAEKLYSFESSTGKKFSLNLQQIMSIYAFSKREQAYSHLLNGGFVFEKNSTVIVEENGKKKTYIHNGAASYKLNEATLNEIIGSLTKEQKAYVDEMQAYLSDVMGAKGNEVSMKLYGIQMFKEKFYFPLRSSGDFMERAKAVELQKEQGQINLVNSGFTHAVKPKAKNPIILSGFMDVWAEHCNEMSMYHSMVLPMEDFRKVYNYSTVHDDKFDSASVQQAIIDAYGDVATKYIDQLYSELNGGVTVDPRENFARKMTGKFKKAAVMLSASVVVQQFSSVGRAYALIDPKYFIGTKVNSGTSLSAADEMKKYAPVAIIKEMGGFDTGTKGSAKSYIMAEQYGKGERIQGFKKDEQYRSDLMGILPSKADEKTWCAIWEAVKRETKANHPKMDVKSEEFLKLAGDRFSEVIEKTQVYDSVLARSANMRSKGGLMQMATSFMAEPTTTVNLLEDALRGRSVKKIARAFGAVAVSIVLNNALASVVYAMRDDDEDETFIEKYFQSFASGMIDDINPMSYYPFLKDVYSLFQGYDVERADMSVIADLRDAMKKAVSLIGKDTSEMDEDELAAHWKNVNSVMMSLLDAGCSAFGVPVKNVRRDAKGLINAWNTIDKDLTERDTTWTSFWDKVGAAAKDTIPVFAWTKDRSKQDKLYEAIIKGDTQYVARLKSGYKTDDAYHSAIRKVLRENDPRIHEAAQAKYNGNSAEYKRIFKEIQKEGKFSFDDIMESINSELNAIKKEVEPASASSNYSSTDFVNAIVLGETSAAKTIREDIIDAKVNNGDTREEAEESFASSVATATRNAFDSGLLNEAGVAEILTAYAGMDDEEADGKINYWSFVKAHPQYRDDLTQSNVEKYHEFAEPAEIPLDVYVQYVNGTKGLETIRDEWGEEVKSKREQVLEVIDSLDLTWRQKDALYLAAGYAESKIMDVPW